MPCNAAAASTDSRAGEGAGYGANTMMVSGVAQTQHQATVQAVLTTAATGGAAAAPRPVVLDVPEPDLVGSGAERRRADDEVARLAHGYRTVGDVAGDASSVLSIAGAGLLFARPKGDPVAHGVIVASMAAGAVDTAAQVQRWAAGEPDANLGSTVYAATGLIPGASLIALRALKHVPSRGEVAELAAVGANLSLIGYEMHRVPKLASGDEDASGALSFAAAFSGVAVRMRH